MCELCEAEELEPGDFERALGLFALSFMLADMIAHPRGVTEVMEAVGRG